LLEKAAFPRDKFCGDAWCAPALDILEDMGVLQQLEAEGLVRDTTAGGFVSPSGESYVSTGERSSVPGTRCYAIKRIICDERLARCAAEAGAELAENAHVASATLGADDRWQVRCHDGRIFRGRMLIAADGANSRLARSLGVVATPPQAVASRQYIRGGTHNFKSGGVLFYPSYILPGYVALFRHYNDDLDVGAYVIPGGALRNDRLARLYENELRHDPFLRRALGPRAEPLEPVRIAPIRLGGEARSTARQFMAVGDAAGQTDPLTGEGIHTGMIGGKLAARAILELLAEGDLSERACRVYHDRWMAAFGRDFRFSSAGARMIHRLPLPMPPTSLPSKATRSWPKRCGDDRREAEERVSPDGGAHDHRIARRSGAGWCGAAAAGRRRRCCASSVVLRQQLLDRRPLGSVGDRVQAVARLTRIGRPGFRIVVAASVERPRAKPHRRARRSIHLFLRHPAALFDELQNVHHIQEVLLEGELAAAGVDDARHAGRLVVAAVRAAAGQPILKAGDQAVAVDELPLHREGPVLEPFHAVA
jgi:flavin-dependent dehydrogenase